MIIDIAEERLIQAIRDIGHGDLKPDEVVCKGICQQVDLRPCEVKLIEIIRRHGTPTVIGISDRAALWVDLEQKTEAGIGRKRVKIE